VFEELELTAKKATLHGRRREETDTVSIAIDIHRLFYDGQVPL
jgi:hypothetical protein